MVAAQLHSFTMTLVDISGAQASEWMAFSTTGTEIDRKYGFRLDCLVELMLKAGAHRFGMAESCSRTQYSAH